MKKLLIPVLLLCLAHPAWAQTPKKKNIEMKPYFRVGVGYAMPHGGAVQDNSGFPIHGTHNTTNLPTNNSEYFDLHRTSYSSGVQGILGLGVMFKNIGAEVATNIGVTTKMHQSSFFRESSGEKQYVNIESKSDKPILITPALIIQTGGKINLYARGGITVPLNTVIIDKIAVRVEKYNQATNSFAVTDDLVYTLEYNMRLTPGFSGAMGVKLKANKKLTVWAEAGILSMSQYLKEAGLTSYDEYGVSTLDQFSPSERIIQFEFKGSSNGSSNVLPTTQMPFSNFNISAGVMVDLL